MPGFVYQLASLLALSVLVANVSAWGNYQKSIKTIQSCATQFQFTKVARVPTAVRTVHRTAKWILTATPKPSTCYITRTKTVSRGSTETVTTTAPQSTRTIIETATVTTGLEVLTGVRTVIFTETSTVESGTSTVLAPSGFISVRDDPDNHYTRPDKRDRYAYGRYPAAVRCTKTLKTIHKHTVTAAPRKTTVTRYGETVTKWHVVEKTTVTIHPPEATTLERTVSTLTITIDVPTSTKYELVTVTATIASVIRVPACDSGSEFSGPTGSVNAFLSFGSPNAIQAFVTENEPPNSDFTNRCCVLCHLHVNAAGASDCIGSFFGYNPSDKVGRCWLELVSSAAGEMCSYNTNRLFEPLPNNQVDLDGRVSNGPCGRWKVTGI
ncbi:hypothetical protein DRE_00363 [Drechslerella stenobrocha 248]|uniref:Apple domain-containing protein n=1 Tax=Drechslerella stenobrocha 248 TaxID=1043628 RepID=W7IEE7_9PEZI|nr:hypothetical protein DRE_00363 [Drechslerella stenobrocha 248]